MESVNPILLSILRLIMTIWLLLASSSFLVQHLVMSKHKSVCRCQWLWLHWDVYSEWCSWDIVASLGMVTWHFELMVFPFVKQCLCLNMQLLFVNLIPWSLLAPLLVPTGRWMAQLWNVCIKSRAYCMPGPCLPPLLLRVFVFECGFCLLCVYVCVEAVVKMGHCLHCFPLWYAAHVTMTLHQ